MNRRAFLASTLCAALRPAVEAAPATVRYLCLFTRLDEWTYEVKVPELDIEMLTAARTFWEAEHNAQTAIRCEIDYCRKNHLPLPPRSMEYDLIDVEPLRDKDGNLLKPADIMRGQLNQP